mmetsp:Transcript_50992/g.118495  ORF Transcript_50992/g.118495 Transcript_50992/m.118495 type:complete len:211 (+) Transcript_50992:1-633(+)
MAGQHRHDKGLHRRHHRSHVAQSALTLRSSARSNCSAATVDTCSRSCSGHLCFLAHHGDLSNVDQEVQRGQERGCGKQRLTPLDQEARRRDADTESSGKDAGHADGHAAAEAHGGETMEGMSVLPKVAVGGSAVVVAVSRRRAPGLLLLVGPEHEDKARLCEDGQGAVQNRGKGSQEHGAWAEDRVVHQRKRANKRSGTHHTLGVSARRC